MVTKLISRKTFLQFEQQGRIVSSSQFPLITNKELKVINKLGLGVYELGVYEVGQ